MGSRHVVLKEDKYKIVKFGDLNDGEWFMRPSTMETCTRTFMKMDVRNNNYNAVNLFGETRYFQASDDVIDVNVDVKIERVSLG